MQFQYQIAFSIYFKHAFFADGNLKSWAIEPTPETAVTLRKAGGLLKTFPHGVHVLFESGAAGQERSRTDFLADGWDLQFVVNNRDTAFFNYTSDFGTDISNNYFLFKNTTDGQKGALHAGTFVGKEAFRPIGPNQSVSFRKPFGLIHIQLHQDLEERFEIAFNSMATYWCYLLTQDYLQELTNPAIIHKETKVAFRGPETVQLPDNRPALAFFSTEPLTHRQRPGAIFQLVEEYDAASKTYKVVLPALPGPDPNHISSLKSLSEHINAPCSCIFL